MYDSERKEKKRIEEFHGCFSVQSRAEWSSLGLGQESATMRGAPTVGSPGWPLALRNAAPHQLPSRVSPIFAPHCPGQAAHYTLQPLRPSRALLITQAPSQSLLRHLRRRCPALAHVDTARHGRPDLDARPAAETPSRGRRKSQASSPSVCRSPIFAEQEPQGRLAR